MKTLTFENICSYLPYGLKALKTTSDNPYMVNITGAITDDEGKEFLFYSSLENNEIGNCETICFKPILRSMNLTTPITVDGKEIIPINLLMDIELDLNWSNSEYLDIPAYNRCLGEISSWTVFKGNLKGNSFGYNSKGYFYNVARFGDSILIKKQKELFQWLYKNKFDVDGLIEKGLAIDVNTLDVNLYNS